MKSILDELSYSITNPVYFSCNQIRDFAKTPLANLFKDCSSIYEQFLLVHNFDDNATVADAIEVLKNMYISFDETACTEKDIDFIYLLLYLFAPVVKNSTSKRPAYSPLEYALPNEFTDAACDFFFNKYFATENSYQITPVKENSSSNDCCSSNTGTDANLDNDAFKIQLNQVTPGYASAIATNTSNRTLSGLITICYASVLILLDGRTNESWEPYCLPKITSTEDISYSNFMYHLDDLAIFTVQMMSAALDDDFYKHYIPT